MRSTAIARWPSAPPNALAHLKNNLEKILQADQVPSSLAERSRFQVVLRTFKTGKSRFLHIFQSSIQQDHVVTIAPLSLPTERSSDFDSKSMSTTIFPNPRFFQFFSSLTTNNPNLKWDLRTGSTLYLNKDSVIYTIARGDWEIRVGNVEVGGQHKGIIVEVEYTPLPYLPPDCTFFHQFLSSVFPPGAEWSLLSPPPERGKDGRSKTEWTLADSAHCYLSFAMKEDLLYP